MIKAVKVCKTLFGQFAVWNHQRRFVPCEQTSRAPVDVNDLAFGTVGQTNALAQLKGMFNA